jgi:phosphomannomutase
MNRVVVSQTAAALASYLLDHGLAGGKVIIGFDARRNSDVFARDTAEIMSGAGFQAMITPGPLPTPVVAFGIRHFGCVAAVVVTASHNPPQDNGYKVFLGDGSQIVPPADAEIAARIDKVAKHNLDDVPRAHSYAILGPELVDAYVDRIAKWVPPLDAPQQLRWVYTRYTAGLSLVERVVEACGFRPPMWSPSRPNPIRAFQPWLFRILRNPELSTSRWRGQRRSALIW